MKTLLLVLYIWMPLRQESNLEVFVACRTPEIFSNYHNYNFKQEISGNPEGVNVKIKSQTLSLKNLNHAIAGDERYVAGQDPLIKAIFNRVRQNAISVGEYLQNISFFFNEFHYLFRSRPAAGNRSGFA